MQASQSLLLCVALCVACGSKFEASGAGGTSAGGEVGQAGSEAGAGHPGSGGTENGGSAGRGADAGAGGASAGAGTGGAGTGGAGTGGAGTGGAGTGGAGAGGAGAGGGSAGGSGGSGGAPDCAALKEEYRVAVEKARACTKGSTNQCSPDSTLPPVGCGCPVLVNAKSEFKVTAEQKYQAIVDAHCDKGPICGIACIAYTGAQCAAQSMASGNVFVCSPTN